MSTTRLHYMHTNMTPNNLHVDCMPQKCTTIPTVASRHMASHTADQPTVPQQRTSVQ